MTAAPPGPSLFSAFSGEPNAGDRTRREAFVLSLLGQAAILSAIVYFTSCVIQNAPEIRRQLPKFAELPIVFLGHNGGGGGNRDPLPASQGTPPRASLENQIVAPTVIVPKEMPRLPVEETVEVAPEIKFPAGAIGDPLSQFSAWKSDGPGGRSGIGNGCCNGIGDSMGPGVGNGPPGIFPAGKNGVTVPQAIYSPEPNFSDEARKAKAQGMVTLLLVVGKDGRPYDIRVRQSLGMGLDEKALEAVSRWRFRPATLNGQAVATQIAVEVNFRLY